MKMSVMSSCMDDRTRATLASPGVKADTWIEMKRLILEFVNSMGVGEKKVNGAVPMDLSRVGEGEGKGALATDWGTGEQENESQGGWSNNVMSWGDIAMSEGEGIYSIKGKGKGAGVCYNCWEPGHHTANCPKPHTPSSYSTHRPLAKGIGKRKRC